VVLVVTIIDSIGRNRSKLEEAVHEERMEGDKYTFSFSNASETGLFARAGGAIAAGGGIEVSGIVSVVSALHKPKSVSQAPG